ncbi:MAG: PorV/PorQ family protein [Bacteroidetes bacterium]|jgi:hypothetical protein|nr:PorV/PorQ family protein [Bacteroidota bacterium]MBT6684749.1 PorV/PorQ family protein [Bacteroidota bacterium]MBT7143850.1 PorV/PorQ family protein [Bacteroidota bacterium]MBT7489969.1 PorV/PorQ family protein [Bacteroidota bacterium]
MNNIKINIIALIIVSLLFTDFYSFAGNEQRAGSAGAQELLINPWARSSGWGTANISCTRGLESVFMNVAGTAFTQGTELIYTHSLWLKGTDIAINAFGFSQKVGESGVISLALMSMDFGDIEMTTVEMPEGGFGTFNPRYTTIMLSYAKEFSNSIYGGATVKIINEAIPDLSAGGVAFDAGIQYITGIDQQIKFGITMQNVGPTMKFSGDGLSHRQEDGLGPQRTVEDRSAEFELPSLIRIGASYDFNFADRQRLTLAGNFTSNSFSKDQYHFGMEYDYKNILFLRGGFVYEDGINPFEDDYDTRSTAYTGPTAGFSIQIPLNKEKGSTFSLDYSYRDTDPFEGTHTFGARVSL